MISKAIADGLITFHGLCHVWGNQDGKFRHSEVLDAVLSSRTEWVLRFFSGHIYGTPLNCALKFAKIKEVCISRISLLGLAVIWGDTAAEKVIRKYYRLVNHEVSDVVELDGDEKKMLGVSEVRDILKAYELCRSQTEYLSKLRELFVGYGVIKPYTGKKYFTPEVVNTLFMLFSSIENSPVEGYKVIECSDFKMVPNCDEFDLSAGALRNDSSCFMNIYDSSLHKAIPYTERLCFEKKAVLDYDWMENTLKPHLIPNRYYYGYRAFSADKVVIRKMNKRTKEWLGDAIELTSIWPNRQLVISEDQNGFIRSFAPVFLTRQKGHEPYTSDYKEFKLFIEEEAACFKEMRPKIWNTLEKDNAWQFCINVAAFHNLFLWLERHCS